MKKKIIWIIALILISSAYAELQPGKLRINGVEIPYSIDETQCIGGIKGDSNNDGNIGVYDLLEMFKILQNGLPSGNICCCCINLNNDNIVNTLDMTKLLNLIQSEEIISCGEETNQITGN